jgi:hypothetical protein
LAVAAFDLADDGSLLQIGSGQRTSRAAAFRNRTLFLCPNSIQPWSTLPKPPSVSSASSAASPPATTPNAPRIPAASIVVTSAALGAVMRKRTRSSCSGVAFPRNCNE